MSPGPSSPSFIAPRYEISPKYLLFRTPLRIRLEPLLIIFQRLNGAYIGFAGIRKVPSLCVDSITILHILVY